MTEAVQARRAFLLESQNSDGGWGYFPGKQSWLEPTTYALLALHGDAAAKAKVDRAFQLIQSWQLPDGAWKPNAVVETPSWAAALALTVHAVRGVFDDHHRRGLESLLRVTGYENSPLFRMAHFLKPKLVELDPSLKAWPWLPDTTSWIEPTAHSLVALKLSRKKTKNDALQSRISDGEQMILTRRCSDGGWNYGNHRVLGEDLPSYPETTGIALLGLRGMAHQSLDRSIEVAKKQLGATRSPLAQTWLRIGLRTHGAEAPPLPTNYPVKADILLSALEVIAETGVLA